MELAYGLGHLSLELPPHNRLYSVESQPMGDVADVPAAVLEQLDRPVDHSAPLKERVRSGGRVVIVISDLTRAWIRNDLLLPPLLSYLNGCGIPDSDITVLVAIGTHRGHTDAELQELAGDDIFARVRVVDHDSHDEANLCFVGTTSRGTDVHLNRLAVEADHVILVGGLVYHLMAGFGGGRKSVLPGIAGYRTVQANHGFLLSPDAIATMGSGKTVGNALHEDMMEAAALLNPAFLLNVILSSQRGIGAVVGGNWDTAWEKGCAIIRQRYGVPLAARGDLVIASAGGFPTDINLYQSSKTLDNAFYAVEDGGVIIVLAQCLEGGGSPEFFDWFQYDSLESMVAALAQGFTVPGYVAYHIRRIAAQYTAILVSDLEPAVVRKTGLRPAASVDDAVRQAQEVQPTIDTLVLMPQGAVTLPVIP